MNSHYEPQTTQQNAVWNELELEQPEFVTAQGDSSPYANEYSDLDHQHVLVAHRRRHPSLTGYRILAISLTAGFGLSKVIQAAYQLPTTLTALDWLYGVVVILL